MSAANNSTPSYEEEEQNVGTIRKILNKVGLIGFTLIGAVLGIALGLGAFVFGGLDAPILLYWINVPGKLFIRALTLMIVPLVFSSLVTSVADATSGDKFKKAGGLTVALYTLTTVVGALEGLGAGYIARPFWQPQPVVEVAVGPVSVNPATAAWDSLARISLVNNEFTTFYTPKTAKWVVMTLPAPYGKWNTTELGYHAIGEVSFRLPDFIPEGPVTQIGVVAADGSVAFKAPEESLTITASASSSSSESSESSSTTQPDTPVGEKISSSIGDLLISLVPRNALGAMVGTPNQGASLLQVITFAIAFAAGLAILKKKGSVYGDALENTLRTVLDVSLVLVGYILYVTPVAVFSLICGAIAENTKDTLADTFSGLGVLVLAVLVAFAFHAIVVYGGVLLALVSRVNPIKHFAGVVPAMSIAFASASSASTLPTTMECCRRLGMSESTSRFVLSLGATINMDGNAVFYPMVIIWLADQAGIPLTIVDIILIIIVATLSSMGASPTPGLTPAIILVWTTIFPTHEVPDQIAYCLALDWFLDRCLTTLNVTGDTVVARVVDYHTSGKATGFDSDDEESIVSTVELANYEKKSTA